MNPPPMQLTEQPQLPECAPPILNWWVRGTLLFMALGFSLVFSIAVWLNPYREDGTALRGETHRQLGLPPCTFKVLAGLPCPSCGMTTSFSLLLHGDLWNSLRANAVGTMLALGGLLFVPWSLATVARKRPLFIVSMERALIVAVLAFLILMLVRWCLVVLLYYVGGVQLF